MTPRGEYRLKLASGLLKLGDLAPKDVFDFIALLSPDEQETLRGQIDWLEAYDRASSDSLPRSATKA